MHGTIPCVQQFWLKAEEVEKLMHAIVESGTAMLLSWFKYASINEAIWPHSEAQEAQKSWP